MVLLGQIQDHDAGMGNSRATADNTAALSAVSLGSLKPLGWNLISPHSKHTSSGFLLSFSCNQFL